MDTDWFFGGKLVIVGIFEFSNVVSFDIGSDSRSNHFEGRWDDVISMRHQAGERSKCIEEESRSSLRRSRGSNQTKEATQSCNRAIESKMLELTSHWTSLVKEPMVEKD